MFTSRAEYRLTLRADNADFRLTGEGLRVGCVGAVRERRFATKQDAYRTTRAALVATRVAAQGFSALGVPTPRDGAVRTAYDVLGLPGLSLRALSAIWPELGEAPADVAQALEIDARYAGYLRRQEGEIEAFRREEAFEIPRSLDYDRIGGLSTEVREKLKKAEPMTLGQAGRIPGVTPAAVIAILAHVRRRVPGIAAE
jgi:tRNA uridine 5-carboxymethylaminomethyl modification enzyme